MTTDVIELKAEHVLLSTRSGTIVSPSITLYYVSVYYSTSGTLDTFQELVDINIIIMYNKLITALVYRIVKINCRLHL